MAAVGRDRMQGHYEEIAAEYDQHWSHGREHITWMSAHLIRALRLGPADRIADIGCGTGLYAREVALAVDPERGILCVDPSQAMLRQIGAPPPDGLRPFRASAEDVAQGHKHLPEPFTRLDAIWLKEAVHHFTDPAATVTGLARLLSPGGRVLVVMLPATIAYPLFPEALRRYEDLQPDPASLARRCRAAGLSVSLEYVERELRVDKERYLRMVGARYMSVLSTFDDAELERGLRWMRSALPDGELRFPDRFAFITGCRSTGGEGKRGVDSPGGRDE